MTEERILLAHGSGGQLTNELIGKVFARHFANAILNKLDDAAVLNWPGGQLAFTTDSYVVKPLFFPGGDIGKLAVCGTVNDLAVSGARPCYLSAGFILEEGLPLAILERIVASMAETGRLAGVQIVAGDTKVVERGAVDGLFINTAGIGYVPANIHLGAARLRPGDAILVNEPIGAHGLAVMLQREGLNFDFPLESDCAPLNGLTATLLEALPDAVHWMRDATRGGLATVLNEWAEAGVGIDLQEAEIPVTDAVRAACEFLGLDPLYSANEGCLVVAVAAEEADKALTIMREHPLGRNAAIIGYVTTAHPGRVVLHTLYGAQRLLSMLTGAQLPRIC